MDEPLASLDDQRKQEILPYIERPAGHEMRIPILYVTHARAEVETAWPGRRWITAGQRPRDLLIAG